MHDLVTNDAFDDDGPPTLEVCQRGRSGPRSRGGLKYQCFDATTLAPDELAMWRGVDEGQKAAKVGLMKLRTIVPGAYRYAVAIRDPSDLWLTSSVGDIISESVGDIIGIRIRLPNGPKGLGLRVQGTVTSER